MSRKSNQALHRNPILVTALNPIIGYGKAAEIAKKAYKEGRPVVDVAEEETDLSREELLALLDPAKLTTAGSSKGYIRFPYLVVPLPNNENEPAFVLAFLLL